MILKRPDEFEANPEDPYQNDLLARSGSVEELHSLVGEADSPLVVALCGRFGSGKSAWLRMFAAKQQSTGKAVVEFNAWRQSHTRDPLRDLMSCLIHTLGDKHTVQLRRVMGKMGQRLFSAATKGVIDARDWQSDPPEAAKDWTQMEELRRDLGNALTDAVAQNGGKLVVVIDELDRCLPAYALGVLDTARNVLDVPGVVVVLGLNPDEIQARVRHLYGATTDAATYLRRFVDYTVRLPHLSTEGNPLAQFTNKAYATAGAGERMRATGSDYRDAMVHLIAQSYEFSLRDVQQFTSRVAVALDGVAPLGTPRANLPERAAFLERVVLSLWALRIGDPAAYGSFIAERIDGFTAAAALAQALDAPPEDPTACMMMVLIAHTGIGSRSADNEDQFTESLTEALRRRSHPAPEKLSQAVCNNYYGIRDQIRWAGTCPLSGAAKLVNLGSWQ